MNQSNPSLSLAALCLLAGPAVAKEQSQDPVMEKVAQKIYREILADVLRRSGEAAEAAHGRRASAEAAAGDRHAA